MVAGGIADARRDYLESRRVLRLLGELDDAEVVVLAGYLKKNMVGDYWARHASVLHAPPVTYRSSREEVDLEAIRRAGGDHLLQLGLLKRGTGTTYRFASDPAPPVNAPARSAHLSSLGRLLLRRIGLASEDD